MEADEKEMVTMKCCMRVGGLATALTLGIGLRLAWAGESGSTAGLPKCPVMDEPINFAAGTATDDGPVFFCCEMCIKKFKADPGKYATAVAEQRKVLAKREKIQVKCPVTGDSVDTKVFTEHNGEKVYFCCKDCIPKYKADPNKYKVALANSYTYQTKCPVMDETIDPKAFAVLPTGETIYYCCKRCNKKLLADPAKYASKLAEQGVEINFAKIKEPAEHEHGEHDHDHDR